MNALLLLALIAQHSGDGQHTGTSGQGAAPTRTEWGQNGFVDRTDVSISFDSGTRTFTIEPSATNFVYYDDGTSRTKDSAETIVIPDSEGIHLFYYDGATLSSILNPTVAQVNTVLDSQCVIAATYWNATASVGLGLTYMVHGYRTSPDTHVLLHNTYGARYESGMTLGDFVSDGDGSLDSHAQFSITSGTSYNVDIRHAHGAVTSTAGYAVFYIESGLFRAAVNPGFPVLTTGTGRLAWNNAGALTEATNNNFVLYHIITGNLYAISGAGDSLYASFMGQAEYGTLGAAQAAAETEMTTILNLLDRRIPAALPVATVIFQTSNTYTNAAKARVRVNGDGDDWVDFRNITGYPVP